MPPKPNKKKQTSKRPERKMPLGHRFSTPIISRLWHPDGTPFTTAEYLAAGIPPPTPEQIRAFEHNDKIRRQERLARENAQGGGASSTRRDQK